MKKTLLLCVLACLLLCVSVHALAGENEYSLNRESITLAVGKTDRLKITFNNADKAFRSAGFSFDSSDESIAAVNSSGKVTAVDEGKCIIRVTSKYDDQIYTEIPVTVYISAKKVTAQADQNTLYCGETTSISWNITPENATYQSVFYSSNKDSVATVDEKGTVSAQSKGTAVITVTTADGAAKATVKISVKQQPEEVKVSPVEVNCVVGRTTTLKSTVLPKNADNHKVEWFSSNESIATVSSKGTVKALAVGEAVITAVSTSDASITGSATVHCVQLAKSIAFDQKSYEIILYDSLQLNPIVLPEETSNKNVTYSSSNKKICSVDENGLVTAVGSGKATITAKTTDGSNRTARVNIKVITPVTGVSFKKDGVRVGVNCHTTVTVDIQPAKATNKNMTWYSSDESIAVVSGTNNKVRISGRSWGRATITGVTEDGGFTVTLHANIGSLRNAVKVVSISIRNDRPYIVLKNVSNMDMSAVYFEMYGLDSNGNRVAMSTKEDVTVLTGCYNDLCSGERTTHGKFHFYNYLKNNYWWDLQTLYIAITGFDSLDGFYDSNGALNYTYRNRDQAIWVSSQN